MITGMATNNENGDAQECRGILVILVKPCNRGTQARIIALGLDAMDNSRGKKAVGWQLLILVSAESRVWQRRTPDRLLSSAERPARSRVATCPPPGPSDEKVADPGELDR